jgi:hypothetical protein
LIANLGGRLKPGAGEFVNSFGREALITYGFPMIVFVFAIVPILNFTFSGHGGVGWFIAPLCFPYVILRMIIKTTKGSVSSRIWYKNFFKITIPTYLVIAYPLSWAATLSLRATFGLSIPTWKFFVLMISPVPWWYFT